MAWLDPLRLLGFRVALGAPPSVIRAVAGAPPRIRDQSPDPRLWWVCWLADRFGPPLRVDRVREDFARSAPLLAGRVPPGVAVEEARVPRRDGGTIAVRVYRASGARGGVLYAHGGGWTIGDLDSYDAICGSLARDIGAAVVAVDYRRAPEHRFPAAWDDVADAWRALSRDPGSLGIAGPLAVAGDSAGANLVLALGRTELPPPTCQLLVYPPVDPGGRHPSRQLFAERLFLTRARADWFHAQVFGPDDLDDPRARPLSADLRGTPPTLLVNAGMDILVDEGHAFAAALREADVPVEHVVEPGMVHGFVNLIGAVPSCAAAWERTTSAFRDLLAGRARGV